MAPQIGRTDDKLPGIVRHDTYKAIPVKRAHLSHGPRERA